MAILCSFKANSQRCHDKTTVTEYLLPTIDQAPGQYGAIKVMGICMGAVSDFHTPAYKLLNEGMLERRQDACIGVKRIWHTQDQDLICANDHADALNIYY